jgi:hypothetical protein
MKLSDRLVDLATRPVPLRALMARRILSRFPIGSWERRLRSGAVERPHYAWCVHYAALQARALGYRAMTVVELGVAGGNGLLCLCRHAARVKEETGIEVRVVGFDSGSGLPATHDLRDMHYRWPAGSFEMDHAALLALLAGRAELILGDVSETIPRWQPDAEAPLGVVCFDLDLYSSTRDALPILTQSNVLPRIWCYFDDVQSPPLPAHTSFLGEEAAIREFNEDPARSRMRDNVSPARVFRGEYPESWHQHMWIYHRLNHPRYDECYSAQKHQLRLAGR